jgi:hypothetical protein
MGRRRVDAAVPRTLLLEQAKQADATQGVRALLQERGAVLDEQTPARTVFEGLRTAGGYRRGGYVGCYQPVGEPDVEVLVQAWATRPRRVFWATVGLELFAVVALLATTPPSAVFFAAAAVLWAWLLLAGLAYFLTLRTSRSFEEELYAALLGRFRAAGLRVLDEEQQLERAVRQRLEGEVKERELSAMPKPERRGRLSARGTPKCPPKPARAPPRKAAKAKPPRGDKPGLFGRRGEAEGPSSSDKRA